tara:strand:+ start:1589 stop:1771 length:183 start_codon:yes stop_codon:yes gene_type:complete
MDTEKKNKVISPVDILTKKYKDRLNSLIVMDDYDGGQASVLQEVVSDLEMIKETEKLLVE